MADPSAAEQADAAHDTLMWEAVAAPGHLPDLLEWIDEQAVPAVRRAAHPLSIDAYTASDERAVLIIRFEGCPVGIPDPPEHLMLRPAHQWPFRHLWSRSV
jgi:hypothetical protein